MIHVMLHGKRLLIYATLLFVVALGSGCSGGKKDFAELKKSGLADVGAGKYREGLESFRLALKSQPSDREALYFSGVCYEELGKPDTAMSYFRKVLRLHGPDAETSRRLTDVAEKAEDWDVALEGLREQIKAGEKYESLLDKFYEIYMTAGYLAGASVTLDTMIKLTPEDGRLYLRSAEVKSLMGEFDRAEMILQEALRRFGPTQETYSNMGLLYARQKRYDKAEMFFRKALDINPQNEGVWVNLGNCLSEMSSAEKHREAIDAYLHVSQEMFDRLRLDTIVTRLKYELQN